MRDSGQARSSWIDEVPSVYEGLCGRAWLYTEPTDEDDPRLAIHIPNATWAIFAPQAHPFWFWHMLTVVSLREAPGVDPPKKRYPDAEYELLVVAQDPAVPMPDPREWPMGGKGLAIMNPADAVVQFHGLDDEQAAKLVDLCAQACVKGVLVPDSDHARSWSESVAKTIAHVRDNVHGL